MEFLRRILYFARRRQNEADLAREMACHRLREDARVVAAEVAGYAHKNDAIQAVLRLA